MRATTATLAMQNQVLPPFFAPAYFDSSFLALFPALVCFLGVCCSLINLIAFFLFFLCTHFLHHPSWTLILIWNAINRERCHEKLQIHMVKWKSWSHGIRNLQHTVPHINETLSIQQQVCSVLDFIKLVMISSKSPIKTSHIFWIPILKRINTFVYLVEEICLLEE